MFTKLYLLETHTNNRTTINKLSDRGGTLSSQKQEPI